MTMFRCAEDQSRTGIHNTMEFLQVMVGNAVEETIAIAQPTGYKCMNQFLSTFTSKVFSYVSDIIQIKECTITDLCYMLFHIHVRVESGAQIFCRMYRGYINVANPNTIILLTHTLDSCLLVPITRNSVLSSFNINLSSSMIEHQRCISP